MYLQATALVCMSGLSPDGKLDGAALQTEGTPQRFFVSVSDRPISTVRNASINDCCAANMVNTIVELTPLPACRTKLPFEPLP